MQAASGGGAVTVLPPGLAVSFHDAAPMIVHTTTQAAVASSTQIEEAESTTNHISGSGAHPDNDVEADADKTCIYRHPLFPLMALLFEKCEQATQTPDCPSSDSFDVDIQAFVQHQEQDHKPFFSEDPNLDGLMVKAIQVLRIHLLELEKVNELCKDFCTRYISCLKGKLQSENLLRMDIPGLDGMDLSPPHSGQLGSPGGSGMGMSGGQDGGQSQRSQVVSGGTVYQMVQTPQGLVAQPVQLHSPSGGQQVVHGGTPLSQIGVAPGGPGTPDSALTHNQVMKMPLMSQLDFDDDDGKGRGGKNKRGVLPKQATQIMKSWLFQHIVHPYPTEDEKRQIANQTNLTLLQVNNWFINARRRILQPMLDASNPDGAKTKKNKTQNRPVQRFWPSNLANLDGTPNSKSSSNDGDMSNPSSPEQDSDGLQSPTSTTSSPGVMEGYSDRGQVAMETRDGDEDSREQHHVAPPPYHMAPGVTLLQLPDGSTGVTTIGYHGDGSVPVYGSAVVTSSSTHQGAAPLTDDAPSSTTAPPRGQ